MFVNGASPSPLYREVEYLESSFLVIYVLSLLYRRREQQPIEVYVGTDREVRIRLTSSTAFNVYVIAYPLSLPSLSQHSSYEKYTETLRTNLTTVAQTPTLAESCRSNRFFMLTVKYYTKSRESTVRLYCAYKKMRGCSPIDMRCRSAPRLHYTVSKR